MHELHLCHSSDFWVLAPMGENYNMLYSLASRSSAMDCSQGLLRVAFGYRDPLAWPIDSYCQITLYPSWNFDYDGRSSIRSVFAVNSRNSSFTSKDPSTFYPDSNPGSGSSRIA